MLAEKYYLRFTNNMSKIGKKPIQISDKVDVKISGNLISVKGPKGEFNKDVPDFLAIDLKDNLLTLSLKKDDKNIEKKKRAIWGLYRALVSNMIKGATEDFEKNLEFQGVGYKANIKGRDLELSLGYSHLITVKAPEGITFKVDKNVIKVAGSSKELVGRVAAEIRSKRKPEPYKGSGIRYQGEVIRRKAGKKAITAG